MLKICNIMYTIIITITQIKNTCINSKIMKKKNKRK